MPANSRFSTIYSGAAIISVWDMASGIIDFSTKTQEENGQLRLALNPDRNVPVALATLEDSGYVVCGGHDGAVSIWDVRLKELSQQLDHGRNELVQLIVAHSYLDHKYIASTIVEDQPTIQIWRPKSVLSTPEWLKCLCVSNIDKLRNIDAGTAACVLSLIFVVLFFIRHQK
ncbi:hypothetical protein H1R20_g9461, partial [Candolleomyces eurysporus]